MRNRQIVEEIHAMRREARNVIVANSETIRLNSETIGFNSETIGFNSEMVRRNEIALRDMSAALRGLLEESRAHTRAIFALIDRLDGGSATAG